MSEKDWCNQVLIPGLRRHGTISKNENAAATGSPDYEFVIQQTSGWLEAKLAHGEYVLFEKFQLPWMRKRVRETGVRNVWVVVSDATAIHLFDSATFVTAPREPYAKWVRVRWRELSPRVSLRQRPYAFGELAAALADPAQFTGVQNDV